MTLMERRLLDGFLAHHPLLLNMATWTAVAAMSLAVVALAPELATSVCRWTGYCVFAVVVVVVASTVGFTNAAPRKSGRRRQGGWRGRTVGGHDS
jgi:hypothetical protein